MNQYKILVPEETREVVDIMVRKARENIETDGELVPVVMLGKIGGDAVILGGVNGLQREAAHKAIMKEATRLDADFFLYIVEGYGAQAETQADAKALRAQYRRVKDMPGHVHLVMFQLETRAGYFTAIAERKQKGDKFTFDEPEFSMLPPQETPWASYLPPKGRAQ